MTPAQALFTVGVMAYRPGALGADWLKAHSIADRVLCEAKTRGLKKVTPVKSMWRRGVPTDLAMRRTDEVVSLVGADRIARLLTESGVRP